MRAIPVLAALVLTLALGAPALAGGWAVTTLDQLPPEFRSGETYAIGYTIRQHGVTPVTPDRLDGTTEIQITAPDGAKTLRYIGVAEGAPGHYVANVIFPYEGKWTWQVTQGWFAPQALGTITALPAAAAVPAQAAPAVAAAPAQQPAGPNALLVTALLLATAGAAILFGSRLAVLSRRRATA